MLKEFNRIYPIEVDVNDLEKTFNSKAVFSSDDKNTSTLLIKMSNGDKVFNLNNCTVIALFLCNDEKVYKQEATILDAEQGCVGVSLKTDVLIVGQNKVTFKIISLEDEMRTPFITYKVVEGVFDSVDATDDRVDIVSQLLKDAQLTKDNILELEKQIITKISNLDSEFEIFMQNSNEKINTLESTLNANELNRQNTFEEFSQRINNELSEANTGYQKKEDQSLSTNSKQVTGAINEIYEDLQNKSEFSGSYNDLTEKPDIPSIDGLATEVYVENKVASIVNSAPETLNTLNELATALGNDPNFATTVANQIGTKASNDYVNAELAKKVNSEGYVATENNYSNGEKTKLANVEDNANNYVHPENHEPSIIIQDNEHRFVTDIEKETWNNKLSEHQDISHLAVKSQVDESLSQINQSNVERDKKISSIESVNAVQNARLDTLFNSVSGDMELESNVNNIKLDSSKKGTATVNYIRGNTLVNCAKENKELILNDEINIEGTICTINDAVEGGLVDVELEGLSLNNLYENKQKHWGADVIHSPLEEMDLSLLTEGKEYTVIILNNTTNYESFRFCDGNTTYDLVPTTIGNIAKFTYKPPTNPVDFVRVYFYPNSNKFVEGDQNKIHVLILEGDYTNKPIPTEAFTGIKSVGEEVTLTNLGGTIVPTNANGTLSNNGDLYKLTKGNNATYMRFTLSNTEKFINKTITVKLDRLDISPNGACDIRLYNKTNPSSTPNMFRIYKDKPYIAIHIPSTVQPTDSLELLLYVNGTQNVDWVEVSNKITIVEGDYENSNLEYFEGSIKKYKIETKSVGKNLCNIDTDFRNWFIQGGGEQPVLRTSDPNVSAVVIKCKPNTNYVASKSEGDRTVLATFSSYPKDGDVPNKGGTNTITTGAFDQYLVYYYYSTQSKKVDVQIEEGSLETSHTSHKHHKKVILLDEPHRGIEGGAKDRIIQREGKLYVERKFAYQVFTSNNHVVVTSIFDKVYSFTIGTSSNIKKYNSTINQQLNTLGLIYEYSEGSYEHWYFEGSQIIIFLNKDKFTNSAGQELINEFKTKYLSSPLEIVYSTDTVYEEIKGLDNEYPTYAEVTHVSTNTVIPCKQKIQNTGIECMLKPSTLYSIHDIRTGSGVAKYNLGGAVNTSNKITTGATLTDNYLRLYGKGLTSRDVEVFEGDTPQTPYFTGMLSAFEDKKITQEMVDSGLEKAENLGKYKVGVTVRGKNLFDKTGEGKYYAGENLVAHANSFYSEKYISVYPGMVIKSNITRSSVQCCLYDANKTFVRRENVATVPYTIPSGVSYIRVSFYDLLNDLNGNGQIEEGTVATQYEPYKEYETSILLGNPHLKSDEICVQGGQLGVLHNRRKVVLNGSENWSIGSTLDTVIEFSVPILDRNTTDRLNILTDRFTTLVTSKSKECVFGHTTNNSIFIKILKSKLETQDVAGFKKWLQSNPVTVVYELAEPYFEPLTPQLPRWVLDIFDNSTISIDTIIPVKSKFTYTSYIPSIPAMQETNKNQDDLINVSLCATDEMYMMLEPLLQSVPQTLQINERMMSKMVDLYVAMVMRGLKTIDEVPLRYREEVKKILEQLDK